MAGPNYNILKRTLLLAAFDLGWCFARRMIALTLNAPGLNQPLDMQDIERGQLWSKPSRFLTAPIC